MNVDTEALWLIRNNEMQFWIVCANAMLRFSLWNQITEHWALLFIVQLNCKLPFSLVATFPHFLFARSSYDSLHFEILSFLMRFSLLIFIGLLLLSCLQLNRFSNLSFQSSSRVAVFRGSRVFAVDARSELQYFTITLHKTSKLKVFDFTNNLLRALFEHCVTAFRLPFVVTNLQIMVRANQPYIQLQR